MGDTAVDVLACACVQALCTPRSLLSLTRIAQVRASNEFSCSLLETSSNLLLCMTCTYTVALCLTARHITCVCVCLSVSVNSCVYVYVHAYMCVYVYPYVCACTCTRVCVSLLSSPPLFLHGFLSGHSQEWSVVEGHFCDVATGPRAAVTNVCSGTAGTASLPPWLKLKSRWTLRTPRAKPLLCTRGMMNVMM